MSRANRDQGILLNANVVVEFINDTRGLCIWVVLGVYTIIRSETILFLNHRSHPQPPRPPPQPLSDRLHHEYHQTKPCFLLHTELELLFEKPDARGSNTQLLAGVESTFPTPLPPLPRGT